MTRFDNKAAQLHSMIARRRSAGAQRRGAAAARKGYPRRRLTPRYTRKPRARNEIWVYHNGRYEKENICAERWMRLIYENPVGSAPLLFLLKRKAVSRLYGMYCRTSFSAKKIPHFIRRYQVDMTGCEEEYKNFAEFFSRARNDVAFPADPHKLGSPCEGMASAVTGVDINNMIAAKGSYFPLAELLDDEGLAARYEGGAMLRVRLTPVNYHRIHFFDEGVVKTLKYLNGSLYSVSPLALGRVGRLYCRNKRALTILSTRNFGDVAMVEVGATFVGSIVHCFEQGDSVDRGGQASFFLPGGSLLLMFFQKGTFIPDEALLNQTLKGFETKVGVGEALGIRPSGQLNSGGSS